MIINPSYVGNEATMATKAQLNIDEEGVVSIENQLAEVDESAELVGYAKEDFVTNAVGEHDADPWAHESIRMEIESKRYCEQQGGGGFVQRFHRGFCGGDGRGRWRRRFRFQIRRHNDGSVEHSKHGFVCRFVQSP